MFDCARTSQAKTAENNQRGNIDSSWSFVWEPKVRFQHRQQSFRKGYQLVIFASHCYSWWRMGSVLLTENEKDSSYDKISDQFPHPTRYSSIEFLFLCRVEYEIHHSFWDSGTWKDQYCRHLLPAISFGLVWFYGISTIVDYFMPNPLIYI